MRAIVILATAFLVAPVSSATAQEICSGILTNAAADEIDEHFENKIALELYKSNCRGSVASNSNSTSVSGDLAIKKIPVKLSVNTSANKSKMDSFCETIDARKDELIKRSSIRRLVSAHSIEQFVNCIGLASRDIYFTTDIKRESVIIDVKRGLRESHIRNIQYNTENMDCSITDNSGSVSNAIDVTNFKLEEINTAIACRRQPKMESDGTTAYYSDVISVVTSEGSLILQIPEDRTIPTWWARDLSAEITQVRTELDRLAARKSRLQCKIHTETSPKTGANQIDITSFVPRDEQDDYTLTGGGCYVFDFDRTVSFIQNGTPTKDGRGWRCDSNHVPNFGDSRRIMAAAVYCTVVNDGEESAASTVQAAQ